MLLILNALVITFIYLADLLVFVPKYTRCKYDHTPRVRKLVWKGVCIGLPFIVLVAETIILYTEKGVTAVNWIILGGMALCAVGDIVLEIKFTKGGFLFFGGHILYIIALAKLQEAWSAPAIIVYILMVIIGTVLTFTKLSKKYRVLLTGYNFAISGSFALSLPLIMTGKPALVLLGAGACCLVISDWLLARNKAYGSNYSWSLISLLFYFGGQMLISAYPFLCLL